MLLHYTPVKLPFTKLKQLQLFRGQVGNSLLLGTYCKGEKTFSLCQNP